MDPTQALADALEALHLADQTNGLRIAKQHRMAAAEALEALIAWIRRGGFAPDVLDAICKSNVLPTDALIATETYLDAHPRSTGASIDSDPGRRIGQGDDVDSE